MIVNNIINLVNLICEISAMELSIIGEQSTKIQKCGIYHHSFMFQAEELISCLCIMTNITTHR